LRAAALILLSLSFPSSSQQKAAAPMAAQVRPVPGEALRQNARLAANLSPTAKSKVQAVAVSLAVAIKQQPAMTAAQLQTRARAAAIQSFPDLGGMDADAVVFLVLMQCVQDQQADLNRAMNAMQQNAAAKQAVRSEQAKSTQQASDVSEMQSMQLQMLMDQRSKLLETMSNVMKTASDAQSSMIANLK
jgi:hypothetical protein